MLASDFTFTPSELTVEEGAAVIFRNQGGFHNVRADDGSFRCAQGCDAAGGNGDPSSSAWSFTRVFTSAGMVPFYCEVHGNRGGVGMAGRIVVR